MSGRVRGAAAAALLAGPTVLAFFSGGYFDRPRLLAGLAAWGLVAVVALLGPTGAPRGLPGRLAVTGLAALAALAALSATWAPLRGPALDDAGRTALYLGALLAAAALLRGRAARAAEPTLLAGIALVIVAGLSERLLPGVFELARSKSAFGRLEQPLTYWNAVGALAAMGLVLALRVAGDPGRGRRTRAAATAACAPLGAGLLLTFSRGSLLAAGTGVLLLCVLVPTSRQLGAVLIGSAIAALSGAAAALLPAVATLEGSAATRELQGVVLLVWLLALGAGGIAVSLRLGERGSDVARRIPTRAAVGVALALGAVFVLASAVDQGPGSAPADGATAARLSSADSNRYDYWKVAARAFAEHPLRGVGSGGFRLEWARERTIDDDARDAHGLAIETAAELGLLGLAFLTLVFGGVGVAARRGLASDRALTAGPAAALAAWFVHAQIDWDWEMPALTLVAVLLTGLLLAAGPSAESHRPRVLSRLGLVLVSLAIALPLAAALRSAILTDRAIAAAQAPGRLDGAAFARVRDLLRRAGQLNPDPNPEVIDASLLINRGREQDAARNLERIVRTEPENSGAWRLLAVAVRQSDPQRSADAERRARALAPRRPG